MIAAYAKLARASATQFETMAVLKGKRRSTRQQLTVTHEKHITHTQHVHLEGGADETGVQPHASQRKSPDAVLYRAALTGPDPIGATVHLRRREGPARRADAS